MVILLAVIPAVLVTSCLMFQRVPSWYRPVAVAPAYQQRAQNDLVGTLDVLGASLVHHDGPFEHRFTQDQVNEWLAVRERIPFLDIDDWLPPELSDPFVGFEPDGIRIAGTYQVGVLRTVVWAWLVVSAEEDGIHVRLEKAAAGALAAPESWIRKELARLDRRDWPAGERSRWQYGPGTLPPLAGLFEGVVFPSGWLQPVTDGEIPFRIIGVRCEPGALVVTLEPLRGRAVVMD
jgi:hypothetical protein